MKHGYFTSFNNLIRAHTRETKMREQKTSRSEYLEDFHENFIYITDLPTFSIGFLVFMCKV